MAWQNSLTQGAVPGVNVLFTRRQTLYGPALAKVCVGFISNEVVPSPNVQVEESVAVRLEV